MRTPLLVAAASAVLVAGASAQRDQAQISSGTVTSSFNGFNNWRIVSPKTSSQGSGALAPRARVMYAVFMDRDANANDIIAVRRSTDGGYTFEPAVAAWTSQVGEVFSSGNLEVGCEGDSIFLTIEANRDSQGNVAGVEYQWVVGSEDQGQTWQSVVVSTGIDQALSTGDLLSAVDDPAELAVANGRCHVVFNARYASAVGTGGTSSTQEDNYYNAAEFVGGTLQTVFAEERRLETYPSGTIDSDDPTIAADGNTVLIAWQDISGGGSNSTGNDSYSVVSTDAGATLSAPFNHTNFAGTGSGIDFHTRVAVEGNLMIVTYMDSRLSVDRAFVSIDNTGTGTNWTTGIEASAGPAGTDCDNIQTIIENGVIYVGYEDDRTGADEIYVVVDRNGGADLINGTQVESLVTSGTAAANQEIYNFDASGDTVAIAYEPELGAGEGAGFSYSEDAGASWNMFTAQAGGDVDDVYVTTTVNQDVMCVYQYDFGGGNGNNNIYAAGTRTVQLADESAAGNGIVYSNGNSLEPVILLPCLAGPASNGLTLPSTTPQVDGFAMNIAPDALTAGAIGSIGVFITFTDQNGDANWPFPDFTALVGQPVWYVAASVTPGTGEFNRKFTDPTTK